jgi:pyruvate dehydrogenase E1 component alpha subunit
VVFVCENNQYAFSTPARLNYASETLSERARGYGFAGVTVDGTDVLAVHDAAKLAIERAREGGGPALIEAVSMRMSGHAIQDDASYVPRELLAQWEKRDPIETFRRWLADHEQLSADDDDALRAEVDEEVLAAVARAERSPAPAPETLAGGVYAEEAP